MNSIHTSIETIFKFEKIDKRGNVLQTVGPFPNLVTDVGLDHIANQEMHYITRNIKIGSGASAPQYSDTDLENEVAITDNKVSDTLGGQKARPSYSSRTSVFQFNEGEVIDIGDVNVTEVGLGDDISSVLFNRQLLPEAINIAYDQGLRIQAETRYYYKDTIGIPTSGSFLFNGETINYKRYLHTDDIDDRSDSSMFYDYTPYMNPVGMPVAHIVQEVSINPNPGGGIVSSSNYYSYIPGTHERTAEFIGSPGNLVGDYYMLGIGYGYNSRVGPYCYFIFDTPITMTDLEELTLNIKISGGRYDSSKIEEFSPWKLDVAGGKSTDINYGSDYDGFGSYNTLRGSPSLSGDYVHFDGVDDGILIAEGTLGLDDTMEIKFRAHDKFKDRYQVIYNDGFDDDDPGWTFAISPSGDIEFGAGDHESNAEYISLPSSGYNENEIYYLFYHTGKHTIELYDVNQNLIMENSFEESPGYDSSQYGDTEAGYAENYCILDKDSIGARYFFEGDIFHIYRYRYII